MCERKSVCVCVHERERVKVCVGGGGIERECVCMSGTTLVSLIHFWGVFKGTAPTVC